jgi:hypothetical protein
MPMPEKQAKAVGERAIMQLGLVVKPENGRIATLNGDKTPIHLGRTIARWVDEARDSK